MSEDAGRGRGNAAGAAKRLAVAIWGDLKAITPGTWVVIAVGAWLIALASK